MLRKTENSKGKSEINANLDCVILPSFHFGEDPKNPRHKICMVSLPSSKSSGCFFIIYTFIT